MQSDRKQDFLAELGPALKDVLGERYSGLVVYGSGATGRTIPRFSDLDLALFLHGKAGVRDMIAIQERIGSLDMGQFAYVQLSHVIDVDREPPHPVFVPGAWRVAHGDHPGPGWEHTESTLRASAESVLHEVPDRLLALAADWAVANAAHRPRKIRQMATDLKPALRALLTLRGEPPVQSFIADYEELAERWTAFNRAAGVCLSDVARRLPPAPNEEIEVGSALLSLLSMVIVDEARCRALAVSSRA